MLLMIFRTKEKSSQARTVRERNVRASTRLILTLHLPGQQASVPVLWDIEWHLIWMRNVAGKKNDVNGRKSLYVNSVAPFRKPVADFGACSVGFSLSVSEKNYNEPDSVTPRSSRLKPGSWNIEE